DYGRMRRTTPLALLLAAVFLTVATSSTFTPIPPGVIAPNVIPLWRAGIGSVVVFVASESRWLRERVPFLRSHGSRLRRLIERGQALKIQAAQLPTKGNSGFREVSDAVLDTFHKWADESDAFAADL